MKIVKDNKENTWYEIGEWKTKAGLTALVLQCVWKKFVTDLAPSLHSYYAGYVEVPKGVKPNENDIEVHGGVTYNGPLIDREGIWIGFDIGHYGDEINQDESYAREQCEKLAEQIVSQNHE